MNFADEPIIFHTNSWQQGWIAEEVDDHWEVYYTPTERMRIGADGSLSLGGKSEYIFQTREWAEMCARHLNSLDTAFGRGPATMRLSTTGSLGIGTFSPAYKLEVRGPKFEPLVTISDGGQVTQVNIPALTGIWWRGTTAYRAWRKLMWGEKA
jgi:hypothetical protein